MPSSSQRASAFLAPGVVARARMLVTLAGVQDGAAASRRAAAGRLAHRACGSRSARRGRARRTGSRAGPAVRSSLRPSRSPRARTDAPARAAPGRGGRGSRASSISARHSATSSAAEEDRPAPRGRSPPICEPAWRGASSPRAASSPAAPRTKARQPPSGARSPTMNSSRSPRSWAVAWIRAGTAGWRRRAWLALTVTPWAIANGSARPPL